DRPHLVGVGGGGAEPRVLEAGGRAVARRPDLGEVAAARALAAPDLVVGDAGVVGRRTPAEVDLGRASRGRSERAGRRRRLGVAGRGRLGGGVAVRTGVVRGVDGAHLVGVRRGGTEALVLVTRGGAVAR